MISTLHNEHLQVTVSSKGAELQSIFGQQSGIEFLWQADPAVWGKHSPLLFPIVGTLKDNRYHYQGKWYTLPRHGFARDLEFEVEDSANNSVTFTLTSSEDTLKEFPFNFIFKISYRLSGHSLITDYHVKNPGTAPLLFSIGAHPAFNVPLVEGLRYEDYRFEFERLETAERWPITVDGLISSKPTSFFDDSSSLPLTHELFANDALVFKSLLSEQITLRTEKDSHGLHFRFKEFPFMGLWAAKNANFVCIEPWCGIADHEFTNQQLEEKEGIIHLEPSGHFNRAWEVEVF